MRGIQNGNTFTCHCGDTMPVERASEHQCRDFGEDFCLPVMKGFSKRERERIGIALDTAIAFGVLEYIAGNKSLQDVDAIRQRYWFNVGRLKVL